MISLLLVLLLSAKLSYSCSSLSTFDFKFYITSGTNDWVVSTQYPNGVYASVVTAVSNAVTIPAETSWIWESPSIFYTTITITRYFFVFGIPYSAILIGAIDDTGLARINGGTSCSISGFTSIYTCDFTSSILPGLNKLEVIATDTGAVKLSVMYKLTIVSKMI